MQLENVTKELTLIAEQCDHLQSGQHEIRSKVNMCCSDHNHLLADSDHAIKVTQQLTLLAEKHSEQLNQIQNDIVNINLATSSKPETTEIETNDTSHTKKIRDFPSNAPTAFLESNMNETEGDLPVDENTSFDDTSDIKYHPYAHRMSKNSRGVHSHVPVFKVPFSCSNVVIGDSNLQSIVRRKLDPSGSTVIRTYRGANMKRIINILDSCQICFPNVQKVMFSIGAVDCNKDVIKESYIFDDLDMLIDCAKRVFPSARIGFLSIPPQLNHKANVSIERINNRIFNYLKSSKSTTFLKCVDLWDCVDRMGKPERSILQNGLLLSDLGITLLFKPVLQFLFEGSLIKNRRHQTSGTSAYNRLNVNTQHSNPNRTPPVSDINLPEPVSPQCSIHSDKTPSTTGNSPHTVHNEKKDSSSYVKPLLTNHYSPNPFFPSPQMVYHMPMYERARMSAICYLNGKDNVQFQPQAQPVPRQQ